MSRESDVVSGEKESGDSTRRLLLTRFVYRVKRSRGSSMIEGGDLVGTIDPLTPTNLAYRFLIFEIVCLPGVLAQSCQDFDWVLIIDEELDPQSRARLERLVARRQRSHLHVYAGEDLSRLAWLEQYVPAGCSRVVTTLLDDDDGLPREFMASLRDRVAGPAESPPIKVFGCQDAVQWDLVHSKRSELGYWAPWHRDRRIARPPMSCGFSLLTPNRPDSMSVFRLIHRYGEVYFDLDFVLPPAQEERRKELLAIFGDESWPWGGFSREELFCDLSPAIGPVVMTNHFSNAQWARLFERKRREPVGRGEGFPIDEVAIDWELARARKKQLTLTPRVAWGILRRAYRYLGCMKGRWLAKAFLALTIPILLLIAFARRLR
ncbi:MAG: glycosyltransferase [Planctomycetota bacterium]